MVLLSLCAAVALVAPQSGPGELPFHSLGSAYLELADARAETAISARGDWRLYQRLEPLHRIVRVGVIEVWVPELTLDGEGQAGKGLDLSSVRPYAEQMLALQRHWLAQTGLRGAELARHEAALEVIGAWVAQLDGQALPEIENATYRATRVIETWFQKDVAQAGEELPERDFELVMILAPNRAHYFGLLGAAGLVLEQRRDTYWNPAARRSVNQWLTFECLAVAMSLGPNSEYDPPLADSAMDSDALSQQMIHAASHLLSNRVMFGVPSWFREGLAIRDTVSLTKDDDTLCSGYSESRSAAYSIPALAALLPFLEIDLSPYRDGPAQDYFVKLLRPNDKGEFTIHDLDLGKRAFTVSGPFLDRDDRMPDAVFKGSQGIRRGFAEFMRAYSAAFVQFLSEQQLADRSVLAWTIEFVRQRRLDVNQEDLLPTALRMVTMKTLGESGDPERDLEAAFNAWLGTRK